MNPIIAAVAAAAAAAFFLVSHVDKKPGGVKPPQKEIEKGDEKTLDQPIE